MAGGKVKLVQIDEQKAGQRVDNYLLTYFSKVPKSRIYRALRSGEVRVNKHRVKPVYRLQLGDMIRIPPLREYPSKQAIQVSKEKCEQLEDLILYEDEYLLVLNKPAGIAAHAGTGDPYGVIEIFRTSRENQPFLELAHRIDKETSGCLVLAKSRRSLLDIQQSLQSENTVKQYICFVKGPWSVQDYVVSHSLQKSSRDSIGGKMLAQPSGLQAQTIFSSIEELGSGTLMRAQIVTGRTHQIRVHAQQEKASYCRGQAVWQFFL